MLKDKEVVSDPQRQYEIARNVHAQQHGGINKTTATIAEKFHWVRIKETVSLVIKNCPDCKEGAAKAPPIRPNGDSNGVTPGQSRRAAASGNGASNVDPNSMIERLVNFDQMEPNNSTSKPKSKSSSPRGQTLISPVANMRALQDYNDIPLDPQIMAQQHKPYQSPASARYSSPGLNGDPHHQLQQASNVELHTAAPDTRMATERHVRQGDEPMAYQDGQGVIHDSRMTDGDDGPEGGKQTDEIDLEELLRRE